MTSTILLTKNNVISGTNNSTYRYFFKQNLKFERGDQIALLSADLYYSWRNISTTQYNNSTFSYKWWGATSTASQITYSITIPDGNYTVNDISEYIATVMKARCHYIVYKTYTNGTLVSSEDKFYINLEENATSYSVQINCLVMPVSVVTTTTTGFVNPSVGKTGDYPEWVLPATTQTNRIPKLTILSTNNFGKLIGFSSGSYPSDGTVDKSKLSDLVPQMSPVSSCLLTCNFVDNDLSDPDNVLHTFNGSSVDYGEQINIRPNFLQYYPVKAGMYNFVEIKIFDQDLNQMQLIDPDVLFMLTLHKNAYPK